MITINYRDPRPVYEQIMDELRKLIISGALAEDEKLPSVRDLARQLAINPNTIQRAYRELEAEGWCYSVPGKGSFAENRNGPDRKRIEELYRELDNIVMELRYLGAEDGEILRRIHVGEQGLSDGNNRSAGSGSSVRKEDKKHK